MRLIDADELIKILLPHSLSKHSLSKSAVFGWHSGIVDAVIEEIEKTPTVDAIPIEWLIEQQKIQLLNQPVHMVLKAWEIGGKKHEKHETDGCRRAA